MVMSPRPATPAAAVHARRGLIGLAVGAVLASAATVLVLGNTSSLEAVPIASPATSTASPAEQVYAKAAPGDCLTWSTPAATDLASTDCASPHTFEVAADVDLRSQPGPEFAPGGALPGAVLLTQLRDTVCAPAVDTYLQGRLDPHGLFSVGLIDPGKAGWRAGQRSVRCGLQHVGRSGKQFPIRGRVGQLDQSDVAPTGSCQNIASGLPTDPVDCAQPHASEVISVVDLTPKFSADYPSTADQDAYLDDTCRAAADAVLGSPDAATTKGLTVFWNNVAPESWAAGSHRVNCKVGKQLPGGGFAPMAGVARAAPAVPASTTPPPTTTGR